MDCCSVVAVYSIYLDIQEASLPFLVVSIDCIHDHHGLDRPHNAIALLGAIWGQMDVRCGAASPCFGVFPRLLLLLWSRSAADDGTGRRGIDGIRVWVGPAVAVARIHAHLRPFRVIAHDLGDERCIGQLDVQLDNIGDRRELDVSDPHKRSASCGFAAQGRRIEENSQVRVGQT